MTADSTSPEERLARVLVVDDDARVRRALCALLRSSPGLCVAGEAASGPATLRADEELRPDVVLLDILLPSADDGLAVLDRLAAKGRAVVALSVREGLRPAVMAAGAAGFVDKYSGPDALLATLVEVLARTGGRGCG
ncbi:MAG TPA: response regulator transcription factor [Acidimicrobiales bacterium]|nr:response regulator transcription factor [Acidimicrobiales bacterium]